MNNPFAPVSENPFAPVEALTEKERNFQKLLDMMHNITEGLPPCYGADIDESEGILSGPHKGRGPRYCSKCHKLLFRV